MCQRNGWALLLELVRARASRAMLEDEGFTGYEIKAATTVVASGLVRSTAAG